MPLQAPIHPKPTRVLLTCNKFVLRSKSSARASGCWAQRSKLICESQRHSAPGTQTDLPVRASKSPKHCAGTSLKALSYHVLHYSVTGRRVINKWHISQPFPPSCWITSLSADSRIFCDVKGWWLESSVKETKWIHIKKKSTKSVKVTGLRRHKLGFRMCNILESSVENGNGVRKES